MRTFRATIAYDGRAYCGWQVQADRPSVQQTLEAAVERITSEPTRIVASGRTGVIPSPAVARATSSAYRRWRSSSLSRRRYR